MLLLSNDDGYLAQGVRALAEVLSANGEMVRVVAPDRNCSGVSHCLTLNRPLLCLACFGGFGTKAVYKVLEVRAFGSLFGVGSICLGAFFVAQLFKLAVVAFVVVEVLVFDVENVGAEAV